MQQHSRDEGSATDFCGQLERRWAAGVRSAAPAAALRRSCITGHRINPKPRRTRPAPQAAESADPWCPMPVLRVPCVLLLVRFLVRLLFPSICATTAATTISAIIVHGSSRSTRTASPSLPLPRSFSRSLFLMERLYYSWPFDALSSSCC